MHDVMIIGSGSGGYAAAIRAAQLGANVIMAEYAETGGTCVNRGCIPSKVWLRAADLLQRMKTAEEFGIKAPVDTIDFSAIVERKNGVSAEIRMGMEALLQNNGVEVIRGRATLISPQEVEVDGKSIKTKKIIIATGSSLCPPEISGLKKAAMTTDDVLDLTVMPKSVLVYGSDHIDVEIAFLLNTMGCSVIMATKSARILSREDSDTSQRIARALRENGVEIILRAVLESVEMTQAGVISLGCARRRGDRKLEILAVKAGVNCMSLPSDEAIRQAKDFNLEIQYQKTCCSVSSHLSASAWS